MVRRRSGTVQPEQTDPGGSGGEIVNTVRPVEITNVDRTPTPGTTVSAGETIEYDVRFLNTSSSIAAEFTLQLEGTYRGTLYEDSVQLFVGTGDITGGTVSIDVPSGADGDGMTVRGSIVGDDGSSKAIDDLEQLYPVASDTTDGTDDGTDDGTGGGGGDSTVSVTCPEVNTSGAAVGVTNNATVGVEFDVVLKSGTVELGRESNVFLAAGEYQGLTIGVDTSPLAAGTYDVEAVAVDVTRV